MDKYASILKSSIFSFNTNSFFLQIIDAPTHKDYKCEMITQNEAKNRYYIKSSIKDNTTGESLLHSEAHVEASKIFTKMIINNTSQDD